ncbi:unnamed protein product [Closterium sp. NIES-54]
MGEEKMPEEGDTHDRWIEKSAMLYDLILQSVNNDMFQHIKDLVELDDSGPKAWKLLRDVIQPNMLPMVIVLEKELAALSMRPGDDVKPVLDKIKDTYARMAAAGSNVSQMQQCTKIISILQEDFRRRHTGGGAANKTAEGYGAAGGSRGRGGGRGRGRGRGFGRGRGRGDYNEGHGSSGGRGSTQKEGACWYCKKAGHPWFKCFSQLEGWAPPGMKPPSGECARGGAVQGSGAQGDGAHGKANPGMFLMVEDVKGSEGDVGTVGKVVMHPLTHCVIDSGCTSHMTPWADLLDEVKPLGKIKFVVAASGALLPVIGVGNAKVMGANGGLVGRGNVLLVEGLSANLLSVRRLQKSKAKVTFDPTSCRAKLGKLLLWNLEEKSSCIKDLWQLPIIPWSGKPPPTAAAAATAKTTAGGEETPPTDGALDAVKKVQQSQQPHGEVLAGVDATAAWAKASSGNGDADWETWHERLCHINIPMLQKLVKDGSLKGMEVKEAAKEIGSCPTCLETKFTKFPFSSGTGPAKAPLALVHMDVVGPTRAPSLSGSRYFLTIVDDHTRAVWLYPLKTKGEVAVAVLKEWMLRAQRESGYKVKVIRTDNGGEFIGTDFEAVALVKNRVLATVGDKQWVPYTKWYGSAPAVNMLRAYGCMVVFHVPKEKRGKLEVSGRWGVHLGLAKDHKGWLIWDLTSQQLTVSRDVKFLESFYYKEWKQQQQKLPTTLQIIEADEVQQPSRQVQVTVSEEEISGVTEAGGEPEVEQQQQQQQQDAPQGAARPADHPRRDVRLPNRVTYPSFGKPKVVRAGSVAEQCDVEEIAHCYWAAVPEPKTLAEALSGPDAEKWKQSVKEEYDSLLENETWEMCELPPEKKAISSKLIFRHNKGDVTEVLIDWIRAARLQLRQSFGSDFPVLRLHSDRGGEFSSGLLGAYCRARGIRQTFTLPDSPQQNGIAERHIGMVMDVARTSMMHAAAPHFLWPFAVRYAAHQINLHPLVSRPETSPALLWTGKVGDASAFRVWGSRAFVCDLSADKLSPRAAPCGPAPSGVSQVDVVEPVEVTGDSGAAGGAEPGGADSEGAEPGGSATGGAEPGGAATGGAEPGGAEPGGTVLGGAEPGGAATGGAEPGGASPGCAAPGGAELRGAPPGGSPGVSSLREPLSPQELREWFARRWRRAASAGGSSATEGAAIAGPGGARTVSTRAAGPASSTGAGAAEGVGTETTTGGPAGCPPGAAGGSGATGGAAGEGAPTGGTGAVPVVSGVAARPRPYFVPLLEQVLGSPPSLGLPSSLACSQPVQSQLQLQPTSPLPAPSPYTGPTGGLAERREPASCPASPVRATRTSGRSSRQRPPIPGTHRMSLRPSTAPLRVPLPSPPESSLPALADPESDSLRAASPTVTRLLATVVTGPSFESAAASALVTELVDFAASCRLDYAASLVTESESICPPSVGGECALGTDVLEDRQEEFQCLAAASPHLVSVLLTPEGDPDALDIPTPRSYAEAIEGTYVDTVPPPGANIVSGMWIFRVKRPPGSPPVFKARYVARGFSQRQGVDYFQTLSPTPKMTTLRVLLHVAAHRDYELHSLDFSTAFLQGSLHEEIWLRRPLGFTGTFPPGTQTTLAALGFAPSTADLSLFLRTDTSLPPFYILVYVDDLVFATADTARLAHVKSELQKRHTCTHLGELRSYLGLQITRDRARRTITLTQSHMVQQVLQRFGFTYSSPQVTPLPTRHSLSALPSDESVESSGPYPELVGCLMVLRYLCSTSGMRLVLGGRSPVVLTGHADASWAEDQATQRSSQGYTFSLGSGSVSWRATRSSSVLGSSCEAEIYAGAMAAQELCWLTYLLIDLGEPPRSPPVMYVDNKAMLALCREQRLEHRTKHIALRYFLARELQQRGQLRLAYVASQANTADVFTKALAPCDHQRFSTQLGLVPVLPHLLTS